MKTLLVYSGSDGEFQNFEAVPPLGLIALYSKLPEDIRHQTKLLDGTLVGTDYISKWIEDQRPDVVGISSLTFGYQNAIKIGEAAKENGSVVVLGGRHATDVLPNILSRMSQGERQFDYVVSGEGEMIFRDLIDDLYNGREVSQQRNLFSSRNNGDLEVLSERKIGNDLDFPVLDYSILRDESSPEKYMEKLGRVGVLNDIDVSMPIISQRGCAYMGDNNHCKFCSIPRVNPKLPFDIFERSLEDLINNTSADHVWITEGDFTASIKHVKSISDRVKNVKERTGKDFMIYCFSRADDLLRENMIDELYDMGVRAVFIGYEHASDDLLKTMKKNTTRQQNIESTQRLADKGIEVTCGGIVLGTPPETKYTLEETIGFAEELSEIGNVRSIFASPVYPFPGAPYWSEFLDALNDFDSDLSHEIRSNDVLEEESLVRLFQDVAYLMPDGVSLDRRPSFDHILETKETISSILGKGIQFTKSF